MQGKAQAHLLMADDGQSYVVKFNNNPQHRRILVNEFIASVLLRYLRISTPETAVIRITRGFLRENPDIYLQVGTTRRLVTPGRHFGSRYPDDPRQAAVYDFLADAMLDRVVNLSHFLGALVADKWVANSDTRQCIFFRRPPTQSLHSSRSGFIVQMIDNGSAFDGGHWRFPDSPLLGMYFQPSVYSKASSIDSFQPWLDEVIHFPERVVEEASAQVPKEWLEGDDRHLLDAMLDKLLRRRSRVADLVRACLELRVGFSPQSR